MGSSVPTPHPHFPRRATVRLLFLVLMTLIPWRFSSALDFKRHLLFLNKHLQILSILVYLQQVFRLYLSKYVTKL